MKSYLKDLLELFPCNWNTILFGWRGLGSLSPWPDDWERFPSLLSEDELNSYCQGVISSEISESTSLLIVTLMDELADANHTRTSILECIKPLAGQKYEKEDLEFRKWRCAMVYSLLHNPGLDEFELARRLDELWIELGTPDDVPSEISMRFLSRCTNPQYDKMSCVSRLRICRNWLRNEIMAVTALCTKGMDAEDNKIGEGGHETVE